MCSPTQHTVDGGGDGIQVYPHHLVDRLPPPAHEIPHHALTLPSFLSPPPPTEHNHPIVLSPLLGDVFCPLKGTSKGRPVISPVCVCVCVRVSCRPRHQTPLAVSSHLGGGQGYNTSIQWIFHALFQPIILYRLSILSSTSFALYFHDFLYVL